MAKLGLKMEDIIKWFGNFWVWFKLECRHLAAERDLLFGTFVANFTSLATTGYNRLWASDNDSKWCWFSVIFIWKFSGQWAENLISIQLKKKKKKKKKIEMNTKHFSNRTKFQWAFFLSYHGCRNVCKQSSIQKNNN